MDSRISDLFELQDRMVVGVMSGTSMDGVDVAVVRLSGSGTSMEIEMLGACTVAMHTELADALKKNMNEETSSVREIALLNVRLAHLYADAIHETFRDLDVSLTDVHAIGSHGQTLYHQPIAEHVGGKSVSGTLQIGDASVLANLMKIPVVGDFRLADVALGGQGAPLVPYFDFVSFRSETEGRLLLNLGGIANFTVLPAACTLGEVVAFDTGPANVVIDGLASRLLGVGCDRNGEAASAGDVNEELLGELLKEPYFSLSPPKSTGRELFSTAYIDAFFERAGELGLNHTDLFATATALTHRSIARAWRQFVEPDVPIRRLIVAGGGIHNGAIMRGLRSDFGNVVVETTAEYGIDPDAKEAICFAVLAHETLNGVPSNVPSATGASRATILGKICLPG